MLKTITILVLLTSSISLSSCQNKQGDEALAKQSSDEYTETVEKLSVNAAIAKTNKPCKVNSPPIKDKNKIKTMLLKGGKITADMSELQADKVVRDYIKKKQDTFKHCKK